MVQPAAALVTCATLDLTWGGQDEATDCPNTELIGDQCWVKDGISVGRITLTAEQDKFDFLYVDASGAIVSATSDGGTVTRIGQTDKAISVVVSYPGKTIETWTFINSSDGPEALWSSNKYGTAIPKIAAFRAPCSLLDLE